MDVEQVKKKLHTALKFGGFNIRREFCGKIVAKFLREGIDLENKHHFDNCVKNLCSSLENQCLLGHSIEKEHIDRALEVCLKSGYDRNETIFSVINAFDFPKVSYNLDRKQYYLTENKPRLLSSADSKAQLFADRYATILHRTKRNFIQKATENTNIKLELQTVDYLLTLSNVSLNHTLVLGSLLQVSEGKYYLEDPTGIVQLDLSHAVYYGGLFAENCFVLVNGHYEDKIIKVSTLILPPGEEYANSRPFFNTINYFGGPSPTPLKDSVKLRDHLQRNRGASFMFFSNVWLDHPSIFEKLELLFEGFNPSPPAAFVFMGNFMSESCSSNKMDTLRKLFKQLAELINKYENLATVTNFIFVPGLEDPCTSYVVPRLPIPSCITEDMTKMVKKAVFTSNPCRLQYCNKEITIFRADVLPKLLQASLHKPKKSELSENLTRTIISQGHLSPLPLNALTVHWDFDYTLSLNPLPDLVVIGDKAEPYEGKYKGCQLINPGSFCESGFQFKAYNPATDKIEECLL
ncbi:DNA polymerase epsilon subunit 2 [Tribolium castaneum]|uniref:DNA polymerase epsilon subunit n=1 Tax=Tribolium castaneum TaxID=7070 RepID=A0A139WFH4_TRICA|nr:PREDICTED: DNA polymerase epsilon subunit 2 [Tribolium castaneum]KYB26713.1 DNA polymerase epsilon subunit 2-like Protein [Tribolium castaneum]|eukprot:XP_968222.2 PREDICTED: DNA polymerase epsilon subunit 2 [Tribolium castaneum]